MWFRKKTLLRKLILEYGKDTNDLLQFAAFVKKDRLEDISLEDIKAYYTALVEPQNSQHLRQQAMKAVRKLFREYRGVGILKAGFIADNPLISVDNLQTVDKKDTIIPMQKISKKETRGRKIMDISSIKKVKALKDTAGLSFREIGRILKKDVRQVYTWYTYPTSKLKAFENKLKEEIAIIPTEEDQIRVYIQKCKQLGMVNVEIGKNLSITGSRVQQINSGKDLNGLKPIEEIKNLTKRKRASLGLPIDIKIKEGGLDFIRELIRIRDNHTCQECRKVWKEGTRRLDVHHMDEEMEGRSKEKGIIKMDKENMHRMVTLCHKCHFNTDNTRKRLIQGIKSYQQGKNCIAVD